MPTVREALAEFRNRNNLDPHSSRASKWRLKFGPITIRLPNFRWRQKAILKHDLHHLITGYPCSITGECQMATWEFAAGRYPHPASTAFCLPLVILGWCLAPGAIWAAFQSGRRGRSLYGAGSDEMLLEQEFKTLKTDTLSIRGGERRPAEVLGFLVLLVFSALITFTPLLLIGAVLL